MTHASLFSGIGGFDLAAEWAGWDNKFHCEWNEFGRKVLNYYWPKSKSYEDITKTDFTIWRGRIDVLTGGFPCQPYSQAGKRLGKEDERHLWPEMLRAVREIQPRWIVGENVLGIVNWSGGLVFEEVQSDLEAEGYEVQTFVLPAASVNAPHKRDRVWFVAYSEDNRPTPNPKSKSSRGKLQQRQREGEFRRQNCSVTSNSCCTRLQRSKQYRKHKGKNNERRKGSYGTITKLCGRKIERSRFGNFPTQPPICGGNDGVSNKLDGITFPKWRNESIKGFGNAICPQVFYQIAKSINEYELLHL